MQHPPWNYCGNCSGFPNNETGRMPTSDQANFGNPSSMLMPPVPGAQSQQGVAYSPEAPVVYTDNPEGFRYQQTMMPCSQGMTCIKFCPPMVFPPPENQCDAQEAAVCGGPAGLHELLGWPMFAGQYNHNSSPNPNPRASHAGSQTAAENAAAIEEAAASVVAATSLAPGASIVPMQSMVAPMQSMVAPMQSMVAPMQSMVAPMQSMVAPMQSMVKPSTLGSAGNVHTVGGNGCPKVSIVSANGAQGNINVSNIQEQAPLDVSRASMAMDPNMRATMAMDPNMRATMAMDPNMRATMAMDPNMRATMAMDPAVRASMAAAGLDSGGNSAMMNPAQSYAAGSPSYAASPLNDLNGINKDNLCHIIYVYRQ